MSNSAFYLGAYRAVGTQAGLEKLLVPAHHPVTHGVVMGTTGSGKTGLSTVIALFYQSMQLRIDGKMTEAHDLLDQVVKSPTVELVELTIARDLLRAASNQIPPQLPTDVTVP